MSGFVDRDPLKRQTYIIYYASPAREGLVQPVIIIIIIIKIIATIRRGRRDVHSRRIVHNIYIIIYLCGKPVVSGRTRYTPMARGTRGRGGGCASICSFRDRGLPSHCWPHAPGLARSLRLRA